MYAYLFLKEKQRDYVEKLLIESEKGFLKLRQLDEKDSRMIKNI